MSILDTIERLGEQEETISQKEIVSPVFYNQKIVTRIEGIVLTLDIPKAEPGWYTFKPVDNTKAKIVGPADIDKIQNYLKHLPKIRLILALRKKKAFYSVPMKGNTWNFKMDNLLPVYLFDDTAEEFAKCICRFDGVSLWFDSIDLSEDPIKAQYLRDSLKDLKNPTRIKHSGLTKEEKIAYTIKYKLDKKIIEESKKTKIQRDVEFAGGKFVQSQERSDHHYVTYKVDGETFHSVISKDPKHQVITAGICLTDHNTGRSGDADFDLKSLVSVIREGINTGQISRTLT